MPCLNEGALLPGRPRQRSGALRPVLPLRRRRHGTFEQRRGLWRAFVLPKGRRELTRTVRLLVHHELRVHNHAVPLRPMAGLSGWRTGRSSTAQILDGAGRGGVWREHLGECDRGGTSCERRHWSVLSSQR